MQDRLRRTGKELHRNDQAVTALGECFDIARGIRIIVERHTEFLDRRTEALLKIDVSVRWPEAATEFTAPDYFAGAIQQQGENLKGLLLQPYAKAVLAKFATGEISFKGAEAEDTRGVTQFMHDAMPFV